MKKSIKKSIAFLISFIMIFGSAPLNGFVGLRFPQLHLPSFSSMFASFARAEDTPTSGTCGDNLTWEYDEDTGTLTISGTGEMSDYSTADYNGATVTTAPWQLYYQTMKTLVISNGVTGVGKNAFNGCTGMTCVSVPDSMKNVKASAFYNCTGLTEVQITDLAKWCDIIFFNSYVNPLYYAHNLYLNNVLVTDLVIPNSVTAICDYAFNNCSCLTGVTIPGSVTSIGDHAFDGCNNITNAVLENGIKSIENYAFRFCEKLTSINLPDSITSIGEQAFQQCYALLNVSIPKEITTIKNSTFFSCTGLITVTIPGSVTNIGQAAFGSCNKLMNVIYYGSEEKWNEITIQSNNTPLLNASRTYRVTSGTCGTNATWEYDEGTGTLTISGTGAMNNYSTGSYNGATVTTAPWRPYHQSMLNVVVGSGITNVGGSAFYGCTGLTGITLPESVTSLGSSSFYGCILLSRIVLPNRLTSIGGSAFYGCTFLKSVMIPVSVTVIGQSAFNASKLAHVYYFGTEDDWSGVSISSGNTKLTSATIHYYTEVAEQPAACAQDGHSSYSYWSDTDPVEYIDEPVTYPKTGIHKPGQPVIENETAATCTVDGHYDTVLYCTACGTEISRETIVVPATGEHVAQPPVTEHELAATCTQDGSYDAVVYCSVCSAELSRETITIPALGHLFTTYTSNNNATCTEDGTKTAVCDRCEATDTITDEGTALGHSFTNYVSNHDATLTQDGTKTAKCDRCDAENTVPDDGSATLKYVVEDNAVTITECQKAFAGALTIPDTIDGYPVTKIGDQAFYNCVGLTGVTIPDSVITVGDYAFEYCTALESVTMGNHVEILGSQSFYGCSALVNVTIPDSVVAIGDSAFQYCTSLSSVTLGGHVTAIGNQAFFGCTAFRSVSIGDSVSSIGDHAFDSCPALVIRCINDSYAYNYCVENEIFYSYDVKVSDYVPVDYTVYNNHTYELFSTATSWLEARAICEAKGGYLVTVTSAGEQTTVAALSSGAALDGYWLGASDKVTEGDWKWVTGETFSYSNWATGEPNGGRNENYLELYSNQFTWNDVRCNHLFGFICEYDEVRIPYDTPKKTLINNGATTYARFDFAVSWEEARLACERMGGHLATITTAAENNAIASLCSGASMTAYWLGGTDGETEGIWKWITGEAWDYTAWESTQPDNYVDNDPNGEDYLEFVVSYLGWNDAHNSIAARGFICEFDANYIPIKSVIYNNHLYSLYNESLSWTDAEAVCVQAGGHLVSITSAEEQEVINGIVDGQFKGMCWIGLTQQNPPTQDWIWSSGEPVGYTNWGQNDPDDLNANYAHMFMHSGTFLIKSRTIGEWNDHYNQADGSGTSYYGLGNTAFICEIDLSSFAPSNGDSFGRNYYEVYPQATFWTEAEAYAESRGGHLVTITSAEEQRFAETLIQNANADKFWIGATCDNNSSRYWHWVTDEPLEYSNWNEGEPNNTCFREFYGEIIVADNGGWNDAPNNQWSGKYGLIVEYENAIGSKDGVSWSYDGNTLTLTGSGDLTTIDEVIREPWFAHIRNIQLDGDFDVCISSFRNTEWYADLPDGLITVNGYLLGYKGELPEDAIIVFDNVRVIARDAFKDQVNLKTAMFGETLETVCENAFSGCTGLTTVELSGHVSAIAENAFTGCTNVTVKGYYDETVEAYALARSFVYDPYTVTVTLNPTQGQIENNTVSVIARKALGDVAFPEAESSESVFAGWYTDEACTVPVTAETVFDADATVYAAWLEVSSVVIKTMPDTLQYLVGESLDTTGLVLTATYPTGETRDFSSGFTCTPQRFTRQGKYRVKVDFKGSYAYFYVTVAASENTTLSVASLPDKMIYETGEAFDPTGLTLLLDYGGGITRTITKGFTVVCDFSTAGTKTVLIRYEAGETVLTTELQVEVTQAANVVYADDVSVSDGVVAVPVKIRSNSGLLGFALSLAYDADVLEPLSVTPGGLGGYMSDSISSSGRGSFSVVWFGNDAYTGNGVLFTAVFRIKTYDDVNTEIAMSYSAQDTFDADYNDAALSCRSIRVEAAAPQVTSVFVDDISCVPGDIFSVPVSIQNPAGVTAGAFSLAYDTTAFSLVDVVSDCGSASADVTDKLLVHWNGSVDENGTLFTVRLKAEEQAKGSYSFALACTEPDAVVCRGFTVTVRSTAAARVYGASTACVPGEDVTVDLFIKNNPGIMGLVLNVGFDPSLLTFRSVSRGALLSSGSFDYALSDGLLKLVWNNTDNICGDGQMVRLVFAAAGECENSDVRLTLTASERETFDADWNTVFLSCEDVVINDIHHGNILAQERSGAIVKDGFICGLPAGAASLADYVGAKPGCTLEYDASARIGTGLTVSARKNGQAVETCVVVIFGDVDGDGWYDGTDAYFVGLVANSMVSETALSDAQRMAADCNHDGVIDNADAALLEQAGLLLANVDQSAPSEELQTNSVYLEYCSLIDQSIEITEPAPAEANEPAAEQGSATNVWQIILDLFKRLVNFVTMIFSIIVIPK